MVNFCRKYVRKQKVVSFLLLFQSVHKQLLLLILKSSGSTTATTTTTTLSEFVSYRLISSRELPLMYVVHLTVTTAIENWWPVSASAQCTSQHWFMSTTPCGIVPTCTCHGYMHSYQQSSTHNHFIRHFPAVPQLSSGK